MWLTIPPNGCRSLCTATQKYDEAAKVQAQIKLLGECMRQHFQVVRSHVAAQLDSKITETGGLRGLSLGLYNDLQSCRSQLS